MAAIPPWIKAADPATHFIAAYRASGSLAQARARLAAQQQEFQVEAEIRQREIDRKAKEAEARLALSAEYQRERMDIAQRQLETNEMKAGLLAERSAQAMEAKRRFQLDYDQMIAAGASEEEAMIRAAAKNAVGLGYSGSGVAALSKAMAETAKMPAQLQGTPVLDPEGNRIAGMVNLPTSTGWRPMTIPGYVGEQAGKRSEKLHSVQNRIAKLRGDRTEILKRWAGGIPVTPPASAVAKAMWQNDSDALKKIDTEMNQLAPSIGGAPTGAKNAPAVGEVYKGYRFLGGNPAQKENWEKVTEEELSGDEQGALEPEEEPEEPMVAEAPFPEDDEEEA